MSMCAGKYQNRTEIKYPFVVWCMCTGSHSQGSSSQRLLRSLITEITTRLQVLKFCSVSWKSLYLQHTN